MGRYEDGAAVTDGPEIRPQLTGSAKGTVFPVSIDAAPAARPRKPGLGRLRDPARAALRPLCEELAGSGLAQSAPRPRKRGPD